MSETKAMTLTDFLLARIAEDEAEAAVDALGAPVPVDCWGPERIDAECAAKRRIVELHKIEVAAFRAYGGEEGVTFVEPDSFEDITTRRWMCSTCHNIGDDGPCSTLRLLALPYADHPDYVDSWRP